MKNEKDIKLLMALFEQDILKNKGPSHISDLIILTIKSLMPSMDYVAVNIDYKRYKEELKFWKHYRHGENQSLMNTINNIDSQIYWQEKDDTVYCRAVPILLANKDYLIAKKEIIKNILYTTGNIETLIETILILKLIYLLTSDKKDIIENLKDEIINLTQVDFIKNYKHCYRISIKEYEGNFSADFERSKVQALSMLNTLKSNKYITLNDSINVILNNKDGETDIGKSIEKYIKDSPLEEFESQDYYNGLGVYIYRLRKGLIDPALLKIEEYHLPNIFEIDEGEVFFHSLLNKSKVIKKETVDNSTISYVSSKSGIYKFENKPSN